jgi:hypothetical protein
MAQCSALANDALKERPAEHIVVQVDILIGTERRSRMQVPRLGKWGPTVILSDGDMSLARYPAVWESNWFR